jgi:hypothetical protein
VLEAQHLKNQHSRQQQGGDETPDQQSAYEFYHFQ